MKKFSRRIALCTIPVLLAAAVVAMATYNYVQGSPGVNYKLGVDLVGGTILVYEVDLTKFEDGKLPPNYRPEELVRRLKNRIDPSDLYNVTIRPLGQTRV